MQLVSVLRSMEDHAYRGLQELEQGQVKTAIDCFQEVGVSAALATQDSSDDVSAHSIQECLQRLLCEAEKITEASQTQQQLDRMSAAMLYMKQIQQSLFLLEAKKEKRSFDVEVLQRQAKIYKRLGISFAPIYSRLPSMRAPHERDWKRFSWLEEKYWMFGSFQKMRAFETFYEEEYKDAIIKSLYAARAYKNAARCRRYGAWPNSGIQEVYADALQCLRKALAISIEQDIWVEQTAIEKELQLIDKERRGAPIAQDALETLKLEIMPVVMRYWRPLSSEERQIFSQEFSVALEALVTRPQEGKIENALLRSFVKPIRWTVDMDVPQLVGVWASREVISLEMMFSELEAERKSIISRIWDLNAVSNSTRVTFLAGLGIVAVAAASMGVPANALSAFIGSGAVLGGAVVLHRKAYEKVRGRANVSAKLKPYVLSPENYALEEQNRKILGLFVDDIRTHYGIDVTNMRCSISKEFPVIPVRTKCQHLFDLNVLHRFLRENTDKVERARLNQWDANFPEVFPTKPKCPICKERIQVQDVQFCALTDRKIAIIAKTVQHFFGGLLQGGCFRPLQEERQALDREAQRLIYPPHTSTEEERREFWQAIAAKIQTRQLEPRECSAIAFALGETVLGYLDKIEYTQRAAIEVIKAKALEERFKESECQWWQEVGEWTDALAIQEGKWVKDQINEEIMKKVREA